MTRDAEHARMAAADPWFLRFVALDADAYDPGAIPLIPKALIGLALAVGLRCDEGVAYHVAQAVDLGVTTPELVEAIRLGLAASGSVALPTARYAFRVLAARGLVGPLEGR
jgi:AhpD family alkylhydroperoxidase